MLQFQDERAVKPFEAWLESATGAPRPAGWYWALFEGGAALAEDAVTPAPNRYLQEAGDFEGKGLLAEPNQTLATDSKAALFWRYIAERIGGGNPRWMAGGAGRG
jgi:hypothetical protein